MLPAELLCRPGLGHLVRQAGACAETTATPGPATWLAQMSFTFATRMQVFFNGTNGRQVDVPTLTGPFGILASHVPTLQVLWPGLVMVMPRVAPPLSTLRLHHRERQLLPAAAGGGDRDAGPGRRQGQLGEDTFGAIVGSERGQESRDPDTHQDQHGPGESPGVVGLSRRPAENALSQPVLGCWVHWP
ncbi:ATP synthase subunit delta, mitochondrial [Tupaia chinensis]|uniref:ATP synthase subunit delta, mitochondrial n=1 Tax=Tupaia chinensis TaxID=246437 RepID=L8Y4V9_TUPCH|nr:ATP synthase subunit delta, mitochondrial [Tupaia chinensis]